MANVTLQEIRDALTKINASYVANDSEEGDFLIDQTLEMSQKVELTTSRQVVLMAQFRMSLVCARDLRDDAIIDGSEWPEEYASLQDSYLDAALTHLLDLSQTYDTVFTLVVMKHGEEVGRYDYSSKDSLLEAQADYLGNGYHTDVRLKYLA